MALLAVENVTRRFGGIVALADVSLSLEKGQIVGLIGPNGAGKTTLFNLVTRLYRPNSGRILFDGKDLTRTPAYRIVRLGSGSPRASQTNSVVGSAGSTTAKSCSEAM